MAKDNLSIEVSLPRIKIVVDGKRYSDPSELQLTPDQRDMVARAVRFFRNELLDAGLAAAKMDPGPLSLHERALRELQEQEDKRVFSSED